MITKKRKKLKMSLALMVLGIAMVLGCPSGNNSTGGGAGVPTVESSVPAQNGTAVVGTNIVLTYSEAVQAGSGNITITPEGGAAITIAVGDAQVNITGDVVVINPTNDLLPDIRYGVSIPAGALEDLAGNAAAVHLLTFNTTSNSIPSVSSSVPSSGATDFANTANIVLTYSEAVQAATGDITITPASGSPITIPVTNSQVTIAGAVVTINPTNDLTAGTMYTLTVPANTFESSDDQTDAGAFTLPFTAVADTIAPTVSSSVPADNTTDVNVDANIVLTYSEAVAKGSGSITIKPSGGNVVSIAISAAQVSVAGNVVTINPTVGLDTAATYALNVPAGGFADLAGNATADYTLSFVTAATVDNTAPTVSLRQLSIAGVVTEVQLTGTTGVSLDSDIVLTYSESVQAGSGNITITPMGRTATTIAVTDTTQVTIAGNVVTIDPTAVFAATTMHTVSIPAGAIEDLVANDAALYELSFTTVAATRIVILWVAYSDVIGALVAENLFIVCGNRPPAVVQRSGKIRRFVAAGSGANQNPANFTLNGDGTGGLLTAYSGATPVFVAHSSGTTVLTDNDKIANSYADLFSSTTPLLRTFNQAGLNGTAERSSNEPNQFWTGVTNSGSPNGYVAGPACQLNDSGSFWNFNSTTSALGSAGLSNSVLKVPRVGNAARTDVMASTFGCRTTANILCMTY